MEEVLRELMYEITHLSPEEPDGSHWCKVSKATLDKARKALNEKKQ